MSIEQFIVFHQMEKIKEMLLYEEINLNEMSKNLHYKSHAALSAQFKKTTGLATLFYKQLKNKRKMIAGHM